MWNKPTAILLAGLALLFVFVAHLLLGGKGDRGGIPVEPGVGADGQSGGPVSAAAPDIYIIVIDTARRDHFTPYGYGRDTSPNLSRLARSATTYTNAYSTSSWTSPAHASLLTGLYSVAHRTTQERWSMSEKLMSLPEILGEHGYRTVGLVENPMLAARQGVSQGFSTYHELWRSRHKQTGLLGYFEEILAEQSEDTPLFFLVNILAPHSPYDARKPFGGAFVTDPTVGLKDDHFKDFVLGRVRFDRHQLEHLVQRYDEEILYSDFLVGKMREAVEQYRAWDNALFVVTSDHGEHFAEHGLMGHGLSLHESLIRIPLVVHYPRGVAPGNRVEKTVQLLDLFPTALKIAGVDADRFPHQGSRLRGKHGDGGRPVLAEYYRPVQAMRAMSPREGEREQLAPFDRRLRTVILDGKKLIWASDGRNELYDLDRDPGEKNNLMKSAAYASLARELSRRLQAMLEEFGQLSIERDSRKDLELGQETEEALRSIGYLPD